MTIREALAQYISAWYAGMAPQLHLWLILVDEDDREELEQLVGAFLELAPTVEPHPARRKELLADPLVQRLIALEDAWWDARDDT